MEAESWLKTEYRLQYPDGAGEGLTARKAEAEAPVASVFVSDGATVTLTAERTLCDVKIAGMSLFDWGEGPVVSEGDSYLSVSRLEKGQQIEVTLMIPDTQPNCMVCWQDESGLHCLGITDSGLDGSAQLVELD